ncbi:hypothetical protein MKA43_03260 [[Clostridium] innocuum]|nr:hypothetical protein [[Clostridium] innocuum]
MFGAGGGKSRCFGFSSLGTDVKDGGGAAALPATASIASMKEQPLTLMR